ncbi:MAG: hypothetical protein V3R16_02945 [Nitrospirales bacterium]
MGTILGARKPGMDGVPEIRRDDLEVRRFQSNPIFLLPPPALHGPASHNLLVFTPLDLASVQRPVQHLAYGGGGPTVRTVARRRDALPVEPLRNARDP